ncbi:MAG: PEP-CTERM sorting domain-containing protein [Candidatus Solibacter sp.]
MRYALAALLAILAPAVASAVPICTTGTMVGYQALGIPGCQLGDFVFGNFNYTYTLTNVDSPAYFQSLGESGPFPDIPASGVMVTADITGPGEVSLGIGNASWVVGGWQRAILTITFDVSMLANNLKTVHADFSGSLDGIGTENVFGSLDPPNPGSDFVVDLPAGGGGGTYVYPTVPASYPVHVKLSADLRSNTPNCSSPIIYLGVNVCDGLHEDEAVSYITDVAYGNGAHLSDTVTRFTQEGNRQQAPEPGTWVLVGAGIGLAGLVKRRRTA